MYCNTLFRLSSIVVLLLLLLLLTISIIHYQAGIVEASSSSIPTTTSSTVSSPQKSKSSVSKMNDKDVVTQWELISSLFGMQYKKTKPPNNNNDPTTIQQESQQQQQQQPLLVIGANFGRTGTQSFVEAMRRLNIKCYHFKEGVFETPGHFEIWDDIIDTHSHSTTKIDVDDDNNDKQQQERNRTFNKLITKLAEDGFNATSDMPAFALYKEFYDVYPNARVVVTVRPQPDASIAFATSFQNCILPIYQYAQDIPFRYLRIFQIFVKIVDWSMEKYGIVSINPTTIKDDLAVAHDMWIEKVKTTIPQEKLLIFSYSDGWEPLCDFLSPNATGIQQECKVIIKSGESYPYLNDSSAMDGVITFFRLTTITTKYILPLFVTVVYVIIVRKRYIRKKKKNDDQQKGNKAD